MLNLSLAQELFLVLFSILYGVMLQSLAGLQPFPLARIFRGYIESNGKPKTHFEHCGIKSNSWLICMWRKRVGVSFLLLTIFPAIYFWVMFELLGNPLFDSQSTLVIVGLAFWSALGVFGFYRFYHAITVKYSERLFCDVVQNLKRRGVSFDAKAHCFWGIFYILPLAIILLVQKWFLNWLLNVIPTNLVIVANMFSLEILFNIAILVGTGLFTILLIRFVLRLERKYDSVFFFFGIVIFIIFYLFIGFTPFDNFVNLIPNIVFSLVIAELTLALVWVELSKRPELKLLEFIPIIHDRQTTGRKRADNLSKLSQSSRFLKIREASYPNYEDLKFEKQSSFSVDLSNIGYEEIMVHEYIIYIDGKKGSPQELFSKLEPSERLTLKTQQRHTIDILPLYIESSGLHKIRIGVFATTTKLSKEVWFFISEDFKKLRYVEMNPYKRLLSRIVKAKLNMKNQDEKNA